MNERKRVDVATRFPRAIESQRVTVWRDRLLALRAVTVPTPGISLYRPTADPLALLSIAAFMAMVGLAAAYVPARRAARMDPLSALRRD